MNDRYDAGYDGDPYELVGYDEYGRPIYRQVPAQQGYETYPDRSGQGQYQGQYQGQGQYRGQGDDPYAADGGQQPGGPASYSDPAGPYPPPQHYPQSQSQSQSQYGTQEPYPSSYETPGHHAPGHAGYPGAYDPYGTGHQGGAGQQAPYDAYGRTAAGGQQHRAAEQTAYIPQQARPADPGPAAHAAPEHSEQPGRTERTEQPGRTEQAEQPDRPEYGTEQFAFVEEPTDDSEDVIDWLKFTENRTERREEARRRARSRVIALAVVLALIVVGGVGYLWYAGKLPGLSSSGGGAAAGSAAGAQKRDVIVVHLHDTARGGTSTALLVDNTTTKQGTTVLLPNTLSLSSDDGSTTTLAKSVKDDGSAGTRDQLDTVLGTSIQGTWRLDTPYLQNLVDLVGDIEVDTDADVPDPDGKKKATEPLVRRGKDQTLSGRMAVAYATYRAPGEAENPQLERFGQVVQGVLRKMSSDPQSATVTVQTLAQILDPSLTDNDLGTFLAKLSELAKGGDFRTALLPVRGDGTLSAQTSGSVVKDILGGTAKSPGQGSAVRVSVQNASGTKGDTDKARVALLNGGVTFLEAGTAPAARPASQVVYADDAGKENAAEVAKTLGLPAGSVTKGTVAPNADVAVVLGRDYKPASGR
ncbi:LytR C-terminal domain-containing protein [Streptomyces sp. NPDC047017]|uniref:LytR C-terminal domain-containing protein n=1 Tax=Streptomyces sp. NPDC047017 TaxID=3155024 RepID=UPI0033EE3CB1